MLVGGALLQATVMYLTGTGNVRPAQTPNPGIIIATNLFIMVTNLLLSSFGTSLLRPLKKIWLRDASERMTTGELLSDVKDRFFPAMGIMVLTMIIFMIGGCLCLLPGLLAMFFLSPAPYIVVEREAPIFGSLKISYQWAKNQWPVILILLIVTFSFGFCMGIVSGFMNLFLRMSLGSISVFIVQGTAGVIGMTLGFALFLFYGSCLIEVERAQTGT
ncbi:MAG: hypothetical protein ABEK50_12775 [bacterium]